MITAQMLFPILVSVTSNFGGWNAMYACSYPEQMESVSHASLDAEAKKKCGDDVVVYEDGPHYSHHCANVRYIDQSFAYISCRRAQ